jgi:hypothetical protein
MRPALVIALLAVGCAHSGVGGERVAGDDDSHWRVLTSAHCDLYTSQPDFMAREVISELERDVRVLRALAFPGVTLPPQRIAVLLLAPEQLEALTGDKQLGGQFLRSPDVTYEPHLLVLTVPDGGVLAGLQQLRETVLHEMTHAFVRRSIAHAPVWLNEGLAGYWQTLEIDGETQEAIVGRPPPLDVLVVDWTPLAELVGGGAARFYDRPNRRSAYAVAWGAVHYLYEHHPDQLRAYQAAVRQGRDDLAVWNEVIGMAPALFDQKMRAWYAADQPLARRVARPPLPAFEPEAVRAAAPAEVRVLWARLSVDNGSAPALARAQLQVDALARLVPGSVEAAYWKAELDLARGDTGGAIFALQQALTDHADDARLLYFQAELRYQVEAARPEAERELAALDELFARVVRADASASSLALAARYQLMRRGPEAARPLAEAAVARNGDCAGCLDALALVRHAAHDDAGAAEAESRAVAAWPNESSPTKLLERLAQYRGASPPPPPTRR